MAPDKGEAPTSGEDGASQSNTSGKDATHQHTGRSRQKYTYRVTYTRRGWEHSKHVYPGGWGATRRLLDRLGGDGRPNLQPIEWVEVYRRPVGDWEHVADLQDCDRLWADGT